MAVRQVSDRSIRRLVLGTAQLGMDYGIANHTGKPSREICWAILELAWSRGIRILDTAESYGDAESLIGAWRRANPEKAFGVYTKIAASGGTAALLERLEAAAQRLGDVADGVFAHGTISLADWDLTVGRSFIEARARGLVRSIGVSLYQPSEFREAIARDEIDIVQAPFNALDRRLLDQGLLAEAVRRGKRVFLRSAFLQGLLTQEENEVRLEFARSSVRNWRQICAEIALAGEAAALAYVRDAAPAAAVVIGCETTVQLERNLAAWFDVELDGVRRQAIESIPIPHERIINPTLWP